MIETVIRTWQ